MIAYRERAAAARRLAQAISDKCATTGLIEHAEECEKKAEAFAAQIVEFAHHHQGQGPDDPPPAAALKPPDKRG